MTRTTSVFAAFFMLLTPAGLALAQPRTAQLPLPVERSAVGDLRVAVDAGFGLLYVDEPAYDQYSGRYEEVPVWAAVGGAADFYFGWAVAGVVGSKSALTVELGYRLSTVFDDTGVVHAHEFTGTFRINSMFASFGAGIAGVTVWSAPGLAAPRFSFTAQVGYELFGGLHVAFDTGVMFGPDDDNALERMTALVGYTF